MSCMIAWMHGWQLTRDKQNAVHSESIGQNAATWPSTTFHNVNSHQRCMHFPKALVSICSLKDRYSNTCVRKLNQFRFQNLHLASMYPAYLATGFLSETLMQWDIIGIPSAVRTRRISARKRHHRAYWRSWICIHPKEEHLRRYASSACKGMGKRRRKPWLADKPDNVRQCTYQPK